MDSTLILNEIKSHFKLKSDAELSRFLGVTPQNVSNWKARNTLDLQLLYTKCVGINSKVLLGDQGELFPSKGKGIQFLIGQDSDDLEPSMLSEPSFTYNSPKVVTVNNEGKENIVLVPYKARAGYLTGYGDPEYIKSLPTYRFPNLNDGSFRMFEVKGFSMMPTLHDGSYVIGRYVENPIADIKDDRVYVIITREHGISVKRVLNRIKKYGNLYCKSDNRAEFPPFTVPLEEIQEVWEYKSHISFNVPNPADLFDRINDMEAEIYQLQDQVKAFRKKKSK